MAEYLSKEDMNTGEYISRDETLKIFHQCCDNCTSSYNGVMCRACADADAMDILVDIPAADVQPVKHGRWIIADDVEHFIAVCSECGRAEDSRAIKDMPYCHCGARMDGEK
jgi:hypothetical protein